MGRAELARLGLLGKVPSGASYALQGNPQSDDRTTVPNQLASERTRERVIGPSFSLSNSVPIAASSGARRA